MERLFALAAALALLCLGDIAQADVFNLGTGFTNLETVTVGNAGNAADTRVMNDGTTTYGSVGYTYNIGKYEVTAKQYCDFLNAKAKSATYGLWSPYMADSAGHWGCNIQRGGVDGSYTYSVADDWANRPVNYVSYWDACRFVNWLGNGQGDGDTEDGAYTLNGYNRSYGGTIRRNIGAKWAVTSEDEWYKAAYYDPNKGGIGIGGYWNYPTRSSSRPSNVGYDGYIDPGNHANYAPYNNTYTIGAPYYRTNVGEFENSASAYGTFDQAGNVLEWNESIVARGYADDRGRRGGSFSDGGSTYDDLSASFRSSTPPVDDGGMGFRVVQLVPEPSSITLLTSALVSLIGIRMRRRRA